MGWVVEEKAGRRFDILKQEQEADCGLCCVAMVVNLLGQGKPNSGTVKGNLPKGAYKPSTQDQAGFFPTPLPMVAPAIVTHSTGIYADDLKHALASWGVVSTHNAPSSNIQAAIAGAYAGKPIICHVTWNSGGGHWVVITHSMGLAHFILDPCYGLTINSSYSKYEGDVESGSAGAVTREVKVYGRWTGEWLKIT